MRTRTVAAVILVAAGLSLGACGKFPFPGKPATNTAAPGLPGAGKDAGGKGGGDAPQAAGGPGGQMQPAYPQPPQAPTGQMPMNPNGGDPNAQMGPPPQQGSNDSGPAAPTGPKEVTN